MKTERRKKYFFIGVGGIGMSALALLLKEEGADVLGIDSQSSFYLEELKKKGIQIVEKADDVLWETIDEVIYTSAVRKDEPALKAARQRNIPACKRGDKLNLLMKESHYAIAVTGTHGKTTTAALLAHIFIHSGCGVQAYAGGILKNYGSNYVQTGKDYFIAEVDESDGTIQGCRPHIAVVTNLEHEHVDRYSGFKDLVSTLQVFLSGLSRKEKIVYRKEDAVLEKLAGKTDAEKIVVCEGKRHPSSVQAMWDEEKFSGRIVLPDGYKMDLTCESLMGKHNLENSALAVACAWSCGIAPEKITSGLQSFKGVKRRFETICQSPEGIRFVSDYAHHPTEVKKVLSLARGCCGEGKVCAVFQPHRITRCEFFFDQFIESLKEADRVIVTEIYLAGESGDAFRLPVKIAEKLSKKDQRKAMFVPLKELNGVLSGLRSDVSLVVFMGAGSIDHLAREFCRSL
ncbi:MAG: UDP-N-acetylmuramate--L-alanine ligase [Candidatus Aureabacteria bacterium]|nr:UDP-N-acetylmuramate--L-alanine ligase [Candidatus Auribacterota bacterium]